MVKDLELRQMLEKERRSNVLKVTKIPNVANVRNDREIQRAMILSREANRLRKSCGTAAAQARRTSRVSSSASGASRKNAGVGHQLPYAKYYSSKHSHGSQSSI